MKFIKRFISLLITASIMVTSVLPNFPLSLQAYAADNAVKLSLKNVTTHQLLAFKGAINDGDFNPGFVTHRATDGDEYPAYCINPNKPGVKKSGSYEVDISEYINNPKVYAAITNGYPTKTPAEIGVKDEIEAYYVTQIAIWALVYDNYSSMSDWKPIIPGTIYEDGSGAHDYIKNAMEKIYNASKNATSIPKSQTITATADSAKADIDSIDDTFLSQTFTPNSTTAYKVSLASGAPSGAKITDTSNNAKTEFAAGEQFKVLIPKTNKDRKGSFKVNITAQGSGATVVLWGKSKIASYQDYAVLSPDPEAKGTAVVSFLEEEDTPVLDPPDDPTPGKLLINKVAYGTTRGLAGAVVRVVDVDGGEIGTYTTNEKGQVEVTVEPGAYYVEEIVPPEGYLLDEENHKHIVVDEESENVVTFANKKSGRLYIDKVDADTGELLYGAWVRVALDDGNQYTDVEISGTALVQDLEEGTYTVREIVAPEGYILDDTPHMIKIVGGEVAELVIPNSHKPGILIKKFDEKTGLPLEGAEFSIEKKGGQIVYQGITGYDGTIFVEGLDPDWYVIREMAAPWGYIMTTEHQHVELEAGKTLEVKFDNRPRPKLEILKIDSETGKPLAEAVFKVWKTEGDTVSEYTTDESGRILIENLDEAVYSVEEITAPYNYILETQHKDIELEWGKTKQLIYENTLKPTLIINKISATTGKPIPNTWYKVQYYGEKGGLKTLGTYKTDKNGQIVIPYVDPGWYVITEIKAAQGYTLPSNPVRTVYLSPGENSYLNVGQTTGTETTEDVENAGGNSTTVLVSTDGNTSTEILETKPNDATTDTPTDNGIVGADTIVKGEEKTYMKPSTGLMLLNGTGGTGDTSGTVTVTSGNDYISGNGVDYENFPLNSIVIKKVDAINGKLLAGAIFELRQVTEDISGNSGTIIGRYTTDNSGIIVITGLEPGGYIVEEVKAPTDYLLCENSMQQCWLKIDGTSIVEMTFANYPYGSLLITKVDATNNQPLANAKFKVTSGDGAVVGETNGEYYTDENGHILIPNLAPNSYVITELQAPAGYVTDTTPQTIRIGADERTYKVSFKNQPVGALVINKYDEITKEPLAGADFLVTKVNGEVVGTSNGVYRTDATGTIVIKGMDKGDYVVKEIKAPSGYILDENTKTISIDYGKTYTLTFYNKPLSGLQILKIDSQTKQPLPNAQFTLYKKNGEVVGDYYTDKDGLIIIDELPTGWYKAVETKAPDGYVLDDSVRDFEVTYNQFIKLTFENTPLGGLTIKKVDSETRQPIKNTYFEISTKDGYYIGEYKTDKNGLINLPELDADWYVITETRAASGYVLDEEPYFVKIRDGEPYVLEVENSPEAGFLLTKIDSVTKQPIYGVEFVLYDYWDRVPIAHYRTDNNGEIEVYGDLPEGRYILEETRAADGYILDTTPRTIEIIYGKVTKITWENTSQLGQIQIFKTAGDDNQTNGLTAGTPLANAVFEAYDYKTGNMVDRFVSGDNGMAVSNPLPLGRYIVKEVKAPQYYMLSDKQLDIVLEFANQVVKYDFVNYSANIGVTIRKTGVRETMPGSTIAYTIQTVQNQSSVALNSFYWRDTMSQAVRLQKIVTGTYNQSLRYKIVANTSNGEQIIVADNLSSTKNNVVDCSSLALGLGGDEYIQSFSVIFGNVKAGFAAVEKPKVYVKVSNVLPNNYQFVNKVDVGGKYGDEWSVSNATWTTSVYSKQKLPNTGF